MRLVMSKRAIGQGEVSSSMRREEGGWMDVASGTKKGSSVKCAAVMAR